MKRNNDVFNCRNENHYGDYLQCVFKDPEFKLELKKLESIIDHYLSNNPGKVFVGTFHPDCEPKEAIEIVESLADDFDCSPNDLDELFIFSKSTYYTNFTDPFTYPDEERNQIIVRLWPDTKKKQLLDLWPVIEAQQKEMGKVDRRRKKPENIDMLYAIHRSKKKGMTYARIADLIWEGSLPGYTKCHQYGKEVIKSYHHKFKEGYLLSE